MRVLDALTAEISEGKYGPGEPIPSDAELVKRFGVARETARRAVRVLRERGLVETEWGKGTFVKHTGQHTGEQHEQSKPTARGSGTEQQSPG
ncbi:GntR family transcriptional regulator [Streptomyces sp. NPDC059479]|uniref:GntR family transcriptional regulator n=1 Tax=Streptomyces sp. NPDC059479 TaxID=3346848 RepID=UPI0036C97B15